MRMDENRHYCKNTVEKIKISFQPMLVSISIRNRSVLYTLKKEKEMSLSPRTWSLPLFFFYSFIFIIMGFHSLMPLPKFTPLKILFALYLLFPFATISTEENIFDTESYWCSKI